MLLQKTKKGGGNPFRRRNDTAVRYCNITQGWGSSQMLCSCSAERNSLQLCNWSGVSSLTGTSRPDRLTNGVVGILCPRLRAVLASFAMVSPSGGSIVAPFTKRIRTIQTPWRQRHPSRIWSTVDLMRSGHKGYHVAWICQGKRGIIAYKKKDGWNRRCL